MAYELGQKVEAGVAAATLFAFQARERFLMTNQERHMVSRPTIRSSDIIGHRYARPECGMLTPGTEVADLDIS